MISCDLVHFLHPDAQLFYNFKVWPNDFGHFLQVAFNKISFFENTSDDIASAKKIKFPFLILLFKQVQRRWWRPAVSKMVKRAQYGQKSSTWFPTENLAQIREHLHILIMHF